MKVLMINGSPKASGSVSEELIRRYAEYSRQESDVIHVTEDSPLPYLASSLNSYDALIFVFPLYFDGLPSAVLRFLNTAETRVYRNEIPVYAIVNCGFHEGEQCETALKILKNWCRRTGLLWKGGAGIGAGPALLAMSGVPSGNGPLKCLAKVFDHAQEAVHGNASEELYVSVGIPRLLYKMAAERSWRKQIVANGLSVEDLSAKITGQSADRKK